MFSDGGLTERQTEVLSYISEFQRAEGISPTYREIAGYFGFKGPKAAMDHVRALEKKGYVRRHSGRSRGIELIALPKFPKSIEGDVVAVPILGDIRAGQPVEQTQRPSGRFIVDRALIGASARHRLFALKVEGDSMTGRGIHDGDWVVADADADPVENDVVAALIDGENTLKTFAKKNGGVFLKAENPDFQDITPAEKMVIQGVVRTVIRRMR